MRSVDNGGLGRHEQLSDSLSTVVGSIGTVDGVARRRDLVPVADDILGTQRPVLPVSVVIPTWDEGFNLAHVLAAMPHVQELIIVDADSQDDTVAVARHFRPDAKILLQAPNGKGNATRAGLEVATADYVICMDADGSMDPREIPTFVALLEQGFDVVKGSRGAVGGGSTDFTPLRRAGNRGLVSLYNVLFGTRLTDITFGYIGFRRDKIERMGLYATGFEIEVQMVAHSRLAGLRFAEVPSTEADRISGESHLATWSDGRRVLTTILRSRFQPGKEWWRHVGAQRPAFRELPGPVDAELEAVLEAGARTNESTAVPDAESLPRSS